MGETKFGSLLVDLGLVSEAQLEEATERSASSISDALLALGHVTRPQLKQALDTVTSPARPRLGEVLVELEHITPERLEQVLKLQSEEQRPLGELLVEQGDLTYEQVFEGLQVQSSSTPGRTRVLIVYDSAIMCTTLTRGLTDIGYEVVSSDNPVRALAELASIKPDIVITELEMPILDGAELCRRIKRNARELPVIILTGNEHSAALAGLQAGADDYLRKYTTMKELAARIEGILRRTTATSRMHKLFARYTSDAVVDSLLQAGDFVLSGEKLEVTILFADVRNFTRFSEMHDPERVVKTLNDILSRLADAVLAQGGTIDKFLGDGLMAVFGAPIKSDDHARRGLAAAHGIQHAMDARNRDCNPDDVLEVGVAINTGVVVAGSVGNERRTEYTCIGDPVNVASRLCALADPGEILVGAGTVECFDDPGHFEERLPVFLKGKAQPVAVFRANRKASRASAPDIERVG